MTFKVVNGEAMSAMILAGWLMAPPAWAEADAMPLWAYPAQPPLPADAPRPPRPAPDETIQHVPNSTLAISQPQATNVFDAPDWHPDEHPAPPDVVMHGRKPSLEACAHCHLPNGLGTDMNQAAALAGLPEEYIIRQVSDFKNGARKSSSPRGGGFFMPEVAAHANDEDIAAAAKYYASLSAKPWFRVVETSTIPRSQIAGMTYVTLAEGGAEPLGVRIVEEPEDLRRARLHDSQSGFVAYVPPGSIKRGEALVTMGGKGRTTACSACHGPDLKGVGPVPPIAGRSPAYIVRQLYDIQQGARNGVWSALMRPVVAKLTTDDMVAIAAYTASREP